MLMTNHVQTVRFSDLPQADQQLIEFAAEQADHAYNPLLGRWAVGVAVRIRQTGEALFHTALRRLGAQRMRSGTVLMVGGSNVEDPDQVALCECGEGIALGTAHSLSVGDHCDAIAIVGKREGEEFGYTALTPCHRCRGRIWAYAQRSGLGENFPILLAPQKFHEEEGLVIVTTIGELEQKIPFSARGVDTRQL